METPSHLEYYQRSVTDSLQVLQTRRDGLTQAEAAKRLKANGPNGLVIGTGVSFFTSFLMQVKNLLVVMLAAASAICLYLGDIRTAVFLVGVMVINILIGLAQSYRSERVARHLHNLLDHRASVMRNGTLHAVHGRELVIGDIVYIEAGNTVPADIRIVEEDGLTINERHVTGQAGPNRKFHHAIHHDVSLIHRNNHAFMGGIVVGGTGYGIVTATGKHTVLGSIAHQNRPTPGSSRLQAELHRVTRIIALCTVLLASVLAVISYYADLGLENALLFGLAIIAAMVPSGLAAAVRTALSIAAGALSKHRAVAQHLPAVEAIGGVDVILTDKTGTLTTDKMTVTDILVGRHEYGIEGTGYDPVGTITHGRHKRPLSDRQLQSLQPFFTAATAACNARLAAPDQEHKQWYVVGSPTEGALIAMAYKAGVVQEQLNAQSPEIREFPFDAGRRMMSSLRQHNDELVLFVKGAPETVLERSHELWDGGTVRRLTAADRAEYADFLQRQAAAGNRCIAVAYRVMPKHTDTDAIDMQAAESRLVMLGIASMRDPLRSDTAKALRTAQNAHIKVAILTGDSPLTAQATAGEAALAAEIIVIDARELSTLTGARIAELVITGGAVFARATPQDKLRIVKAVQGAGHTVAVTGDSLQDIPALQRADVGVAMGRDGADGATEAARLVLCNDGFGSLMAAVERGRLANQNIRRIIRCALTTNVSELTIVLIGLFVLLSFRIPTALPAIQILAIDIIAQLIPIIALAWDGPSHRLMHMRTRDSNEHIITGAAVQKFALYGGLAALLSYGNYLFFYIREGLSPVAIDTATPLYLQATTLTYLTLALCLYIHIVLERVDRHEHFFSKYLISNKKLLAAFGISLCMVVAVIYVPVLNALFATNPLGFIDWLTALFAAGLYFAFRLSQRHTRKHSRKAVLGLHNELQR